MNLKCYYSIKTWIVKLFCGMMEIDDGRVKMTNEKTLLTNSYDSIFFKKMTKEIISKLDVKKMELYFTGGFENNSFSSAIVCGSISSFVETLYGYLSLKYYNVKVYEDIKPTFYDNNLELTIDIVVSISLIDLVKCIFLTQNKIKKVKEQ